MYKDMSGEIERIILRYLVVDFKFKMIKKVSIYENWNINIVS